MSFSDLHPAMLAAIIFLARMTDVSLGTVRTILVFRGHRWLAAAIGFVEVLIWVAAAGAVIQNLSNWYLAVAYAAGFAAGNVVGSLLESWMALGTELVRAISQDPQVRLAEGLRGQGYSVTEVPGEGDRGAPVEILLVVERRRRIPQLLRAIQQTDAGAVCTISDVKRHLWHPDGAGSRPAGWRSRLRK